MHKADKTPEIVEHELFPKKFWTKRIRLKENRQKNPCSIGMEPVLIGWMVVGQPKHYLITGSKYGIYTGWMVDRGNLRMTSFSGQHHNKLGLDALAIQNVSFDRTCGLSDYTVAEVFDRFHWPKRILDEQVKRQDSRRL